MTTQILGYLNVSEQVVLVTVKENRIRGIKQLKVRKSGSHGVFLDSESQFFAENTDLLDELLMGATVDVDL